MTALASLLRDPYAIFAGWTLAVVLCATTGIAIVFAGWRLLRGAARAGAEYRAGLIALFGAAAFAAAFPVALAMWGGPTPGPEIAARRLSTAMRTTMVPLAPRNVTGVDRLRHEPAAEWPLDTLAASAALAWAIGVIVVTLRFAGGWLLARRVVRRAWPVRDRDLEEIAAAAAARAGLRQGFQVLESLEVDAPAVLRWRRPVLLVPRAALPRLGRDHIAALLVHELAHIRRRDYLVNLLQSIVELPLFFSPAVRWMSRRVREAREFCCDDDAVAQCGDRVAYVEALTTLAALGTLDTAHGVQGISGPRLIVRVRRLLKEEPMSRFTALRALALATGLVALVVTGAQLSAASAARTPRRPAASQPAQTGVPKIPYGYATDQEGSGVKLRSLVTNDDGVFESATLENVSTEGIVGIRFLAVVERRSAGVSLPVRLLLTEDLPVAVGPGATVDLKAAVLTRQQIDEVARETPGARLQTFYALQTVRFANGYVWNITPNPDATSGSDAIGVPRVMLPRAFIERDAARPPVPGGQCLDDRNREYSQGAVVPILNEPGRFARCTNGRWDAR